MPNTETGTNDNIISFSAEGDKNTEEFNESVVKSLEAWLEDAKEGKIEGMAIVGVTTDGIKVQRAYNGCFTQLMSGVTILHGRMSVLDSMETGV